MSGGVVTARMVYEALTEMTEAFIKLCATMHVDNTDLRQALAEFHRAVNYDEERT